MTSLHDGTLPPFAGEARETEFMAKSGGPRRPEAQAIRNGNFLGN